MTVWYYARENQQYGPLEEAALRQQLQSGALPRDTLVWTDGMEGWAAAQTTPLLAPSPLAPTAAGVPAATPAAASLPAGPVDLSIGSLLSQSLAVFQQHWLMLSVMVLLMGAAQVAIGMIPILGFLVNLAIGGPLLVGFMNGFLDVVDGRPLDIAVLWKHFNDPKRWVHLSLANLCYSIASFGFFMLLLIPGLIFTALFFFWPLLVLDRNLTPWQALHESYYQAKPHMVSLLILILICAVLLFVGACLLLIGILPAAALAGLLWITAYRRISPSGAHS